MQPRRGSMHRFPFDASVRVLCVNGKWPMVATDASMPTKREWMRKVLVAEGR